MINKTYDDLSNETSEINIRYVFLQIILLIFISVFTTSAYYDAAWFTAAIFLVLLSVPLFKAYKKNKAEQNKIKTDVYKIMLNPSGCAESFRKSAKKFHIVSLAVLCIFFLITFFKYDETLLSVLGVLTSLFAIITATVKNFGNSIYARVSKTFKRIVKFFKIKIPNTSFKNFIKIRTKPIKYIQFGIERPPRILLA
jgi:hypothetical protein